MSNNFLVSAIPNAASFPPSTLSPPYSNQQSPPHSVNSLSPAASYLGSPSPAKTRPSLPTSPTHIAAMRAATHQKHGGPQQQQPTTMGFDFSSGGELPLAYSVTGANVQQQQQMQQQLNAQQYYHYLTPPSQHSQNPEVTPQHYIQEAENLNYSTPSPNSPGHWSSSSPHSNSDWSEGIHSPVANGYATSGQMQKGPEAIYI